MLKRLAKYVDKEIRQAQDYIEQAYIVKDDSPRTGDMFITLAEEELQHAEKILAEGKRIIDTTKVMSYNKDIKAEEIDHWDEKCKIIWEWEKRLASDYISTCRHKISMYKNIN